MSVKNQQDSGACEILVGGKNSFRLRSELNDELIHDVTFVELDASIGEIRNRLYRLARGEWVYFVDEDCSLPGESFLRRAREILTAAGGAVGGGYLSPAGTPLFGRVYNFMCDLWLFVHESLGEPIPIAGNFIVRKTELFGFPFPDGAVFGGEEILLARSLRDHHIGFQLHSQLSLFHHCRHSYSQLLSRSTLHGRAPFNRSRLIPALWHSFRYLRREKSVGLFIMAGAYTLRVWWIRVFASSGNHAL
jgi:hypothetical protein